MAVYELREYEYSFRNTSVDSLRSMDELANKLTVMVLLLMEFV